MTGPNSPSWLHTQGRSRTPSFLLDSLTTTLNWLSDLMWKTQLFPFIFFITFLNQWLFRPTKDFEKRPNSCLILYAKNWPNSLKHPHNLSKLYIILLCFWSHPTPRLRAGHTIQLYNKICLPLHNFLHVIAFPRKASFLATLYLCSAVVQFYQNCTTLHFSECICWSQAKYISCKSLPSVDTYI